MGWQKNVMEMGEVINANTILSENLKGKFRLGDVDLDVRVML